MSNWDRFMYVPRGKIIAELKEEGIFITRYLFEQLEREGHFVSGRTVGRWRRYDRIEANAIKNIIREYLGYEIKL